MNDVNDERITVRLDGPATVPVGGIVLAAGKSDRSGTCKALAEVDGEPLVVRAVRTLREGGCDPVVVVVGPPHGARVATAVHGDAERADNPRPEEGMLSSLRCGLRDEWAVAVVSLIDHPFVKPATVKRLIDHWRETGARVVRPVHDGRSGHPYLISGSVFGALRDLEGNEGARSILRLHNPVKIEVDDPAIHQDLDTAEELAAAGVVMFD